MATFRQIVEGIEDNNRINGASWSNWGDATDAIELYGPLEDEDVDSGEAIEVIDRAIASNGSSLADDLRRIEVRVKGQNFAGSWWNRE
ncbi:MAG: hypothetical protein M9929_04135 [Burkholderiaceae bacterium]|nr:hypothetical protein [Burkholderiaceae bacterium]